jgi:integrase
MRRGELLRLKWDHIDFFRDEIKVTHTKNSKDRLVPMNKTVRAMLWAMKEEAVELSEFVFRSPRAGSHLTDIKKGFNAALKEAGVEDFRFHDLRHTFGTMAADAGVEITSIAEVMGHADIHTTRRYSHATDQGRRRAVEAIERHFNSPVTNRSQRAVGDGA